MAYMDVHFLESVSGGKRLERMSKCLESVSVELSGIVVTVGLFMSMSIGLAINFAIDTVCCGLILGRRLFTTHGIGAI